MSSVNRQNQPNSNKVIWSKQVFIFYPLQIQSDLFAQAKWRCIIWVIKLKQNYFLFTILGDKITYIYLSKLMNVTIN